MDNSVLCYYNEKKKTRIKNRLSGVIIYLMIMGTVALVSYIGIKMYQVYTTAKLQEQAVSYIIDNNLYGEFKFKSKLEVGIDVNKGNSYVIFNSSSEELVEVKALPRGSKIQYYKYPDGTIAYPYSLDSSV